jgi:hypothetical protein
MIEMAMALAGGVVFYGNDGARYSGLTLAATQNCLGHNRSSLHRQPRNCQSVFNPKIAASRKVMDGMRMKVSLA